MIKFFKLPKVNQFRTKPYAPPFNSVFKGGHLGDHHGGNSFQARIAAPLE